MSTDNQIRKSSRYNIGSHNPLFKGFYPLRTKGTFDTTVQTSEKRCLSALHCTNIIFVTLGTELVRMCNEMQKLNASRTFHVNEDWWYVAYKTVIVWFTGSAWFVLLMSCFYCLPLSAGDCITIEANLPRLINNREASQTLLFVCSPLSSAKFLANNTLPIFSLCSLLYYQLLMPAPNHKESVKRLNSAKLWVHSNSCRESLFAREQLYCSC